MESRDPAPTDPFEELVSALRAALSLVLNPPSASASPMALPTTYSGEAEECSGFLLQLSLFIEMQPQQFTSERSNVAFLISLLSGRALLWARAIWNSFGVVLLTLSMPSPLTLGKSLACLLALYPSPTNSFVSDRALPQ